MIKFLISGIVFEQRFPYCCLSYKSHKLVVVEIVRILLRINFLFQQSVQHKDVQFKIAVLVAAVEGISFFYGDVHI